MRSGFKISMKSYQWWVTATAVALVLFLFTLITQVKGENPCLYWYVKQPPSHLHCDPNVEDFILACTLLVNTSTARRDVNIRWYFDDDRDTHRLAEIDFPATGPTNDNYTALATWLKVQRGVDGIYYCQGDVERGDELIESNKLVTSFDYHSSYSGDYEYNYFYHNECSATRPAHDSSSAECADRDNQFNIGVIPPTPYSLTYHPITVQVPVQDIVDEVIDRVEVTPLSLVDSCAYQYTTEPPPVLGCNPHTGGGQPIFECSVNTTLTPVYPEQVQIVWYYKGLGLQREVGDGAPVELYAHQFSLIPGESRLMQSKLTVENVQPGHYYCTVNVSGDTLLSSTATLYSTLDNYTGLPPCSPWGQDYLLAATSTRCAHERAPTPVAQFVLNTPPASTMQQDNVDFLLLVVPSMNGASTTLSSSPHPLPTSCLYQPYNTGVPTAAGASCVQPAFTTVPPTMQIDEASSTTTSLLSYIAPAVAAAILIALSIVTITVLVQWRRKRVKAAQTVETPTKDNTPTTERANTSPATSSVNPATLTASASSLTEKLPEEEHYYSYPEHPRSSTNHPTSPTSPVQDNDYSLTRTYSYPEHNFFVATDHPPKLTHAKFTEMSEQDDESCVGASYISHSEIERELDEQQRVFEFSTSQETRYDEIPRTSSATTHHYLSLLENSLHKYTADGYTYAGVTATLNAQTSKNTADGYSYAGVTLNPRTPTHSVHKYQALNGRDYTPLYNTPKRKDMHQTPGETL